MIKIIRKQGLGIYPVYQVDTTAELESLCGYVPVGAHIIKGEMQYIINSLRQPIFIKRLINENGKETWIGLDRLYHLLNINYLCFEAAEADSTVQLTPYVEDIESDIPKLSLEYSTDKIQWTEFIPGTTIITLSDIGDKVYLRGDNETFWHYLEEDEWIDNGYRFEMSGTIKASGSLMSIFDKYDNSRTISAPFACYMLFYGCDSLITAPELPATILSEDCYEEMFEGCISLTTAPELPAMTLTYSCYYGMFSNCTNLIAAPKLPATILAEWCYGSMFKSCTSLTIAPKLPATTLVDCCYSHMFYNCDTLKNIKVSFTAFNPSNATDDWITADEDGCTFTCPAALDISDRSSSTVPSEWTIVRI